MVQYFGNLRVVSLQQSGQPFSGPRQRLLCVADLDLLVINEPVGAQHYRVDGIAVLLDLMPCLIRNAAKLCYLSIQDAVSGMQIQEFAVDVGLGLGQNVVQMPLGFAQILEPLVDLAGVEHIQLLVQPVQRRRQLRVCRADYIARVTPAPEPPGQQDQVDADQAPDSKLGEVAPGSS